jgi:hypothetical protein
MEAFKMYYKFPLKQDLVLDDTVLTKDNEMAFQFSEEDDTNGIYLSNETKKEVLHAINNNLKVQQYFPDLSVEGSLIKSGSKVLIILRGWGNLTGTDGHNLRADKAKSIQNQFALYIINCLTKQI